MKALFEEYADVMFSSIVSIFILSIFCSLIYNQLIFENIDVISNAIISPSNINSQISNVGISSFEVKDILINVGENINYYDRIAATNSKGEDIKDYIKPVNLEQIDTNTVGEKYINYILNYNGESKAIRAKVIVVQEEKELKSE